MTEGKITVLNESDQIILIIHNFVLSYDYLELEDAVDALNERYGAKNPDVEDVIFTNGVLDPYYSFGITEYSNNNSYVFNIPRKIMQLI